MEKSSAVNPRISCISPSVTLGITARAKELSLKGVKVFGFGAGEPDFDTPEHIKQAAIKALEAGQTKYTPAGGLVALQQAIAAKLKTDNGLDYKPSQVLVSCGAKHSVYNAVVTLCGEGDEIIVPGPFWLSYPEMVKSAGGRPVLLPAKESNDFKITPAELEKAVTSRTKAVIINSPSNPTGVVYSRDELKAVAEAAVRKGIYIISDEIYEKMVYDGTKHVSVGSFSKEIFDRTITINGFSKSYSMTGWRIGYCAGPVDIMKAMEAFQSHTTSAPTTFAQFGAVEALKASQQCVTDMVKAFAARRDRIHGLLCGIKGVTCVKPQGAFYVFPNISSSGLGSVEFCERLLAKEGVVLVPGVSFGSDAHVRLSYACSMDNIENGLAGMKRFIESL